jgi:tetratricopeptide (TPR) repeat protein
VPRLTWFRRILQHRHLTTYDAFATQFSRAARELADHDGDARLRSLTVSSRQFDRWMGGELQTMPRPDACRVLEYMLGSSVERLFAEPGAPEGSVPPSPASIGCQGAVPVAGTEEEADRPLEIIARARQLTASNVDEGTLAFVSSSIEGIVVRYEQDGPRVLKAQTRAMRELVHALLDGRQPPRVRQELFRLAARVAGLLGYMAVNTGNFILAEAYCTEARDLSREINDIETEQWANGTLSFGLYYAGRYAEADRYAAAAVEAAPRSAQSIRLLANGRARALAKTGDRQGAEHAISQALELSDLHDVPQGITSCISFEAYGHARTLANAVTAHVSLHNVNQVLEDAKHIDDLVEHSDSSWSRSLVRLDVATALLQQNPPDLEHAFSLGKEALFLSGSSPIRSVWQRSHDLHRLAKRWRNQSAVREYGEELRSWSSQPAALAMSGSRAP